jgi:hypothetical protein
MATTNSLRRLRLLLKRDDQRADQPAKVWKGPDTMKLRPRFWGSTAALIAGALMFLSNPIAGVVTLLGSAAYRSAKRTRLGLAKPSWYRTTLEAGAIVTIVAMVGLQRDFGDVAYEDPVPNLLLPAWALIAYGIARAAGAARQPVPRTTDRISEGV